MGLFETSFPCGPGGSFQPILHRASWSTQPIRTLEITRRPEISSASILYLSPCEKRFSPSDGSNQVKTYLISRSQSTCRKQSDANESSLGSESILLAAGVDFGGETVECGAQRRGYRRRLGHDLGEFGSQQACIGSGKEERDPQAVGCELIPVAVRNAFNDAVQSKTAKVVGHSPDGVIRRVEAQQLRQQSAHFAIVEPTQLETENDQHREQSLHSLVAEAQGGRSLPFHLGGTNHPVKRVFAYRAIVRDLLDVEKTPVGLKADLPQRGQVLQQFADAEVASVVDGGLGAKGSPLLVILLDPCGAVIDYGDFTTPSVMTRVRNRPGVFLLTRRSKINCT